MSVADSKLRVHDLGGLRVIDASVIPAVTSTNTNAPTIMIAEKGAAIIKGVARQRLAA
jgi:choline dehydrogenase